MAAKAPAMHGRATPASRGGGGVVRIKHDEEKPGHFTIDAKVCKHASRQPRGHHGFLLKKGHVRTNWTKRFFRLEGHFLVYYANVPHGTKTTYKGVIPLMDGIRLKVDETRIHKHSKADQGWEFLIELPHPTTGFADQRWC